MRDKKFEKLLDAKKIKWRRVAENKTREKNAERGEVVDKIESFAIRAAMDQPLRVTYQFTATQEQVNGILDQLESSVRRRAGVRYKLFAQSDSADSDNRVLSQSLAGIAGGKASGFTITLVAAAAVSSPAAQPADESP